MAQRRSSVISRGVAPFAPLALALLMQNAVIPPSSGSDSETEEHGAGPAICGDDIDGYQVCHSQYPTGCSKAGKYDADLNLLKNQLVPPGKASEGVLGQSDFAKLEGKLPEGLSSRNHAQFHDDLGKLGEGHVFTVVAYLYYAIPGGAPESTNCGLLPLEDIDFHIGIGFDPQLAAKLKGKQKLSTDEKSSLKPSSVIVEVTPHWRGRFEPDWSLDELKAATGYQVRVVGQLLVDNEHHNTKDDCGASGATDKCWRSSVWELHPVTQFQVCATGTCDAASGDWKDLDDFAKTLTTSAPRQTKAGAGS
jgi:hypothetical protein